MAQSRSAARDPGAALTARGTEMHKAIASLATLDIGCSPRGSLVPFAGSLRSMSLSPSSARAGVPPETRGQTRRRVRMRSAPASCLLFIMLAGPKAVCDDQGEGAPALKLHTPWPGEPLRPWEVVRVEILRYRSDPPLYVSLSGDSSAFRSRATEVRNHCKYLVPDAITKHLIVAPAGASPHRAQLP